MRYSVALSIGALALFFGVAALAVYRLAPPAPAPADAPAADFSAMRALRHVEAIAREPHAMGSAASDGVRAYLVRELAALGLNPVVQETTAVTARWGTPVLAGRVRNIIARLPGAANTRAVLLAAHYDSAPTGPGASDDGAGVAAILEALRAFRTGPPLRNDLIVLLSDGEEPGMLGAEAFLQHPWSRDVGLLLNFEAGGHRGPSVLARTSAGNAWLIREIAQAAPHLVGSSATQEVARRLTSSNDDMTVIKDAGVSALDFTYFLGGTHYHTMLDNAENLDRGSLQHHGDYALALARHFGNIDLGTHPAGDAVYFDVLGAVMAHYPATWALPLLAAAALLFALVVGGGLRCGRLALRGVGLGALAALVGVALASVLAALLWMGVVALRPEERALRAGPYAGDLYLIAFVALALAVNAAVYAAARAKASAPSIAAGVLLWWLAGASVTTLLAPGASFVFVWPLLFGLAGLWAALGGRASGGHSWRQAVVIAAAVPAILLIAPNIYLFYGALTARAAAPVVALAGLLVWLLALPLDLVLTGWRWRLPAAAAGVGAIALAAAGLTAGFDARRPQPDSILYGLDADTGQAIWASFDARPDSWTAQFLGSRPQASRIGAFFPFEPLALSAPAPASSLAAPEVRLLGEATQAGARTLRLRVTSPRGAAHVSLYVDGGTEVLDARIDGERVGPLSPQAARRWGVNYWACPSEGFELTLSVPAGQSLALHVVDQSDGLPALPGFTPAPRPADTMPAPDVAAGSAQRRFRDATLVRKSFVF